MCSKLLGIGVRRFKGRGSESWSGGGVGFEFVVIGVVVGVVLWLFVFGCVRCLVLCLCIELICFDVLFCFNFWVGVFELCFFFVVWGGYCVLCFLRCFGILCCVFMVWRKGVGWEMLGYLMERLFGFRVRGL